MAELGTRIRSVLAEKNLSQAELARMLCVKQQTISYICSADSPATTSRYATKIAEALGINPVWLQTGDGSAHDPCVRIEVDGVDVTLTQVPMMSQKDASAFLTTGVEAPKSGFLLTETAVGSRAVALTIEDESMAPGFRPGDKVLIDPELKPEPGDFVLAETHPSALFRRFRARDGTSFELAPFNEDWSVVRSDADSVRVLGVMVEHRRYRRRDRKPG